MLFLTKLEFETRKQEITVLNPYNATKISDKTMHYHNLTFHRNVRNPTYFFIKYT